MPAKNLETDRLILRQWKDSDLPLFYELNSSQKTMEYFPNTLTKDQSDQLALRIQKELREKPYGLWAVELKEGASFIGFIGLHYQDFKAHFTPCIEIGWRLHFPFWGKGYATEGAKHVLNYAHNVLKIKEVVSFTSKSNFRSIRVMEKLGMTYDKNDDFLHPNVPKGHPISLHVLYRSKS